MEWFSFIGVFLVFLCLFLILLIKNKRKSRLEKQEQERARQEQEYEEQLEREFQETVRFYLEHGCKMDAIKECKDYYDCSLSKAKTIISEIEFELAYEKSHRENHSTNLHGLSQENEPEHGTLSFNIDGMDGHQFEYFCADLLLKNGFDKADVTPGSGDQGVDIVAVKDGIRYAIQCKNYKTPLGNTPAQEVNAGKVFYKCHVGVVMTNSTFTSGAETLAEATGVLLWDRNYVATLIEKAGISSTLPESSQVEEVETESDQGPVCLYGEQSTSSQNADISPDDTENEGIPFSESQQVLKREYSAIPGKNKGKSRTGMVVLAIFMLLEVVTSVIAGITAKQPDMAIGMGGFFGILAFMFFALANTSKDSPCIYFQGHYIKKKPFVLASTIASFVFAMIVIIIALLLTI